jgi:hypothetical protein
MISCPVVISSVVNVDSPVVDLRVVLAPVDTRICGTVSRRGAEYVVDGLDTIGGILDVSVTGSLIVCSQEKLTYAKKLKIS